MIFPKELLQQISEYLDDPLIPKGTPTAE
jgi:hypothetical protein